MKDPQTVQMKGKAAIKTHSRTNPVESNVSARGSLRFVSIIVAPSSTVEFAPGAHQHRRKEDDDAGDGQHRSGGSGSEELIDLAAQVVEDRP
ncbi:hypothetical protein D3C72_2351210 [compost metagenome]